MKKIDIEVADTFLKKGMGLMFRRTGNMLFRFNKPLQAEIWNMFCRFDMDVHFLDHNKKVLQRVTMESWKKGIQFITPPENTYYVLETDVKTKVKLNEGEIAPMLLTLDERGLVIWKEN